MTFFSYKNILLLAVAFVVYVLVVGAFAYGSSYYDDFDYDNIFNWEDLCPEELEDLNGYKDKDGCPDNEEFQALFDWAPSIEGYEIKIVKAHELPFEDDVMKIEYDIDFENKIVYLEKGFNNFVPVEKEECGILERIKADIDIKENWNTVLDISLGNLEVKPLFEEFEVRGHGHREVIIDGITIVEEYPWVSFPIKYIGDDEKPCGSKDYQACFMSSQEPYFEFYASHDIFYKASGKVTPKIIGMSEAEHELLHAWGVSHAEMNRWFNPEIPRFCPCPLFPHMIQGNYVR